MSNRLEEKVAIITGGSRGIGKGIAHLFAAHGAKLLITGRHQEDLDQAAKEIEGDVATLIADVANSADMIKMAQFAFEKFGRIDILCQNAGIYPEILIKDMSEKEWDEVCDINLKGTFLAVKACLPIMEEQSYGRIVVISSTTGPKIAQQGLAHYGASKAGVNGFIKTAALEVARQGITVNGIEPGNIMTEGLLNQPYEVVEQLKSNIPLGQLGTVFDVAYTALFLASDEARYITGETIVVDGGQLLPGTSYKLAS
jgi:3-oxoacyl-[acyl-carrier protein] reductase